MKFDFTSSPLTLEKFEQAAERIRKHVPPPPVEFHASWCPKLQDGQKACRCGTSPLEAVFEDALREKPGAP